MKKYWMVAKCTWDEMLTYRLNFTMYRIRNILTFLTLYYLWLALLASNETLFGYTRELMLTYIVGTALLNAFVLASRSYAIGDDINQGVLSNYLLRPVNYFFYWIAKDIGDKAMNIVFALCELTILYLLLRPPLFIQTDLVYVSLFLLAVIIAVALYFCCNLILGMFGFWSPEIWAPRFIFMILVGFFSGGYFPLDILPEPLFIVFSALPFQYFLYMPLKIYLGQLSIAQVLYGISVGLTWVVLLYFVIDFLWRKGLRVYAAQGR